MQGFSSIDGIAMVSSVDKIEISLQTKDVNNPSVLDAHSIKL